MSMLKHAVVVLALTLLLPPAAVAAAVEALRVPAGFSVEALPAAVPNARQMALGPRRR